MMKYKNPIKNIGKVAASLVTTALLSSSLYAADCTYELFNINGIKGTSIAEYVDQLSSECELTVMISDPEAEKKMNKRLQRTSFKNLTLNEVFDLVLIENNLNYTLEDNILKISFIETKTYNIDYIISSRKSTGSTNVILSNSSGSTTGSRSQGSGGGAQKGKGGSQQNTNSASGIKIESIDEVKFWEELDLELQRVLNRPTDYYQAEAPIVNKNAGLVTVTATVRQQLRLEKYLKKLQKKVKSQVLIDVRMITVEVNKGSSTGIDWSQIYALQNLALNVDMVDFKNVAGFDGNSITDAATEIAGATSAGTPLNGFSGPASLVKLSGGGSINELIKFLKTQGDVESISNPKVLTLNNQPALITVGTEFFYKTQKSNISSGSSSGTSTTSNSETISSVFAGILLDITPEISNNDTITLKINPSISQTRIQMSSDETSQQKRSMPPDLDRRQLASVVTVKDGSRVVIGGLIDKRDTFKTNSLPLLGDIPGLGYLFKYEEKSTVVTELVIIIEPHIIRHDSNTLSLSSLGYERLTDESVAIKRDLTIGSEEANAD